MHIFAESKGAISSFRELIDKAVHTEGVRSLMVLACDENGFTPEQIDPILNELEVPVFGGIFPVVLHEGKALEKGTVVVALRRTIDVHFIAGLSHPDADYEEILDTLAAEENDIKTLLLFLDGLSTRIAAFVDALYTVFGLELNYVGGGAGSLSFEQKPCVITNAGLKADGVVLAALPLESGIGVSHGWKTAQGPFKVTESERNIIKEIEWRPALDVYREVVEAHAGISFSDNNFFDIAKSYPFGIARMESERIVRDILSVGEEGQLVCVAEVPQGEYVDILNGDEEDLIQAAGHAFEMAQSDFSSDPGIELVVDCISRVLFLGDRFASELTALTAPSIPMTGACTIGELANNRRDYLAFYNKTSVVAFLEKE